MRIALTILSFTSLILVMSCEQNKPIPTEAMAKGQAFALEAKKALGGQLINALGENVTIYALDYCNLEASNITQKVSESTGVKISRASDQYRNPENAPNEDQLAYIKKTKAAIASGATPEPEIKRINKKLVGYYPIMTNGMCLQCHGTPGKTLLPETHEKIKTLYPQDKATGYDVNQLRGIWVIEIDEEQLTN